MLQKFHETAIRQQETQLVPHIPSLHAIGYKMIILIIFAKTRR